MDAVVTRNGGRAHGSCMWEWYGAAQLRMSKTALMMAGRFLPTAAMGAVLKCDACEATRAQNSWRPRLRRRGCGGHSVACTMQLLFVINARTHTHTHTHTMGTSQHKIMDAVGICATTGSMSWPRQHACVPACHGHCAPSRACTPTSAVSRACLHEGRTSIGLQVMHGSKSITSR